MFKTIQIIKRMIDDGFNQAEILDELTNIVDNNQSDLFELTDREMFAISEVFENDDSLNKAFFAAQLLNNK